MGVELACQCERGEREGGERAGAGEEEEEEGAGESEGEGEGERARPAGRGESGDGLRCAVAELEGRNATMLTPSNVDAAPRRLNVALDEARKEGEEEAVAATGGEKEMGEEEEETGERAMVTDCGCCGDGLDSRGSICSALRFRLDPAALIDDEAETAAAAAC